MEVLVVECEAEFLAERFDVFEWVDSGRQDEEDGRAGAALLVRLGELHLPVLHVLLTQFLFHKIAKLE